MGRQVSINHYTINSSIGRVLKTPLGADLLGSFLRQAGLLHLRRVIFNPLVKQLPFKALSLLAPDKIDNDLLSMMCRKINTYAQTETIPPDAAEIRETWWKEAVCYQIYPRSFFDSDGDGVGDIPGITAKLDYLQNLGIDIIWLSPVYDSPEDDNGYDIRNYYTILPRFGSMQDFETLLQGVHKRGMKLIMDMVINHTSDEHAWFQKAVEDNNSPYHNYYIFRPGDTSPPNNWRSLFSGSAWSPVSTGSDRKSAEQYLHLFSRKQPDLNWECAAMREELYRMIRWWLDKGVDGFRFDVINFISKEEGLPNGNEKLGELTGFTGIENYLFGPRVHQYLQELRRETFARYDVTTVGECQGLGSEMMRYFVHEARQELDMSFNFDHVDPPGAERLKGYVYDLNDLKQLFISQTETWGNSSWNAVFLENHDTPRMADKVGVSEELRDHFAKMMGGLQLSFRGTPFLFQGQEIGMGNPGFESMDEIRDMESLNYYKEKLAEGADEDALKAGIFFGSRDNSRTPLSWSDEEQAGFTQGQPWIRVNANFRQRNVAKQEKDMHSVLSFYKRMIALRKERRELVYGEYHFYGAAQRNVFAYGREYKGQSSLVVMNLSDKPLRLPRSVRRALEAAQKKAETALSNYEEEPRTRPLLTLRPYEFRIYC